MASSSRSKTADRQAILKKLLPLVKKQYKVTIPKLDRPVMETMLYAVCLEGATVEQADQAFAKFTAMFPDLNEARVSSISELEPAFVGMPGTDWRAFRTRAILQFVFDKNYSFEFEGLRKKTLDLAQKQLAKIKHLSPFVRTFTLQQVIGAHVLPIDDATAHFFSWLGLAAVEQPLDDIGEGLKTSIRKADAHQFCFAIRAAAVDPQLRTAYDPKVYPQPADGHDPATGIDRLTALFKHGMSAAKIALPKTEEPVKKATKSKETAAKEPAVKETPKKAAKAEGAKADAAKPGTKTETAKPAVKTEASKPEASKADASKKPAAAKAPAKPAAAKSAAKPAAAKPATKAPAAKPAAATKSSADKPAAEKASEKPAAKTAAKPAVDKSKTIKKK
jgi:hypothetical protein